MSEAKIRTAFILAAGLGLRLRPLTAQCPKPLLPVGGRPMITHAMAHLHAVGVERFIVNTHHCAEAYDRVFPDKQWQGCPIIFRHEPVLLDTAGGLKNIEDLLDDAPLLIYNGDILTDIDLNRLMAVHFASGKEVTLALRSEGPLRNITLDNQGRICDMRGLTGFSGVRQTLFTGIYIVERRFLRRLEAGRIESVIPVFVRMLQEEAGSVAYVMLDEGSWHDIGSIEEYERIAAAGKQSTVTAS